MGTCKKCGEVSSSFEMRNGLCNYCWTPEVVSEKQEIGFTWWEVWAWLGLTLGNFFTFALNGGVNMITLAVAIPTTILGILILKYNKYAFLIATILSFNPLLWIINGIYLKNRWNHPRVNKK
jgi:hypothetical protein